MEGKEGVAEALVVYAKLASKVGAGAGLVTALEGEPHGLGQRWGLGSSAGDGEVDGVVDEVEEHGVGSGGGSVLDGELQPGFATDEVAGRVGPGVEITAASKRLPEIGAWLLAHMVNKDDGEVMAAIELTQIAEQPRYVTGGVFVSCDQRDYVTWAFRILLRRQGGGRREVLVLNVGT